jgi:hypothetical protein
MLLRLILVLILAFGAPAMPASACDGAAPMATGAHSMPGMDRDRDHRDRNHKVPMAGQHFCVGCVPITHWGAARLLPPILLLEPSPVARIARLPLMPGEAPTPPPPRIA